MKFSIQREQLLKPLKNVIGVLEQRQILQILSHVLIRIKEQQVTITATDSEIELSSSMLLDIPREDSLSASRIETTLPGRKLMDICRTLPEYAILHIELHNNQAIISACESRFVLTTLPATTFPTITLDSQCHEFNLSQKEFRYLIHRTQFAMAQQDVRYFLNGMLLEANEGVIRAVATDGHRLAINNIASSTINNNFIRAILPRKSIIELNRLLNEADTELLVRISANHIQVESEGFNFISNLIEGEYPDYKRIIPKEGHNIIRLGCLEFKQALVRVAILANETFRGVRLQLRKNRMRITTNNTEQEIAEEQIMLSYEGDEIDIGFNINYLIDVLNIIGTGVIKLTLSGPSSSMLIEEGEGDGNSLFVIMPITL